MKKSLIALAVMAAGTGAFAQSSVTLYGRLDLGMAQKKTTTEIPSVANSAATTTVTSLAGQQNNFTGSRVGIKGTEDLGGGLKASFNYEFGLNADNTPTPADEEKGIPSFGAVTQTRLANLALAGGFGQVTIGTFNNAFDRTVYAPNAGLGKGFVGIGTTSQNALEYMTPDFGGFQASLAVSSEKTKTATTATDSATNPKADEVMAGVTYNNGPISVAAAYGKASEYNASTATTSASTFKATGGAISASYDLGFVKPYATYDTAKWTNTAYLTGLQTKGSTNGWELGVSAPLGGVTLWAGYAAGKEKYEGNTIAKNKGFDIGASYDLSKRTSVYGFYTQTKNDAVNNASVDATDKTLAAGLVHKF